MEARAICGRRLVGYAGRMTGVPSDSRSVEELFEVALEADEDRARDAVETLHWRGSEEVLDRGIALTRSSDPVWRALGADVLGQLGIPDRTYPNQCLTAVLPLLVDEAASVVRSAIYALHYIDSLQAAPHIAPLANHLNDDIRVAVAFGLCGVAFSEAHDVLLKLMSDRSPDVRNWATFGIARQSEIDNSDVRSALFAGLADPDEDVRYEAAIGLARRRDTRSVKILKQLLHEDPDDIFAREAAAILVDLDEIESDTVALLGALQRLDRWGKGTPFRQM